MWGWGEKGGRDAETQKWGVVKGAPTSYTRMRVGSERGGGWAGRDGTLMEGGGIAQTSEADLVFSRPRLIENGSFLDGASVKIWLTVTFVK